MSNSFAGPGVDVSHHNVDAHGSPIDWAAVLSAGYTFAFIKASDGNTFTDPKFVQNVQDALAAGVQVGAYHFLRPGPQAADQAKLFLERISAAGGPDLFDLGAAVDVEDPDDDPGAWNRLSQVQRIAKVSNFLDAVEPSFSTLPFIYCIPGWWASKFGAVGDFSGHPLWAASPGKDTLTSPGRPGRTGRSGSTASLAPFRASGTRAWTWIGPIYSCQMYEGIGPQPPAGASIRHGRGFREGRGIIPSTWGSGRVPVGGPAAICTGGYEEETPPRQAGTAYFPTGPIGIASARVHHRVRAWRTSSTELLSECVPADSYDLSVEEAAAFGGLEPMYPVSWRRSGQRCLRRCRAAATARE